MSVINDPQGNPLCSKMEVIFDKKCQVCKNEFDQYRVIIVLGYPYNCLVHRKCLAQYIFTKGWQHTFAREFYSYD